MIRFLTMYFATARERYRIKLLKEANAPWPWTKDMVLQQWQFCNVHREDDKTTRWFREKIREPLRDDRRVVMSTIIFRWFNRIETGERLLDMLDGTRPWDRAEADKRLRGRSPLVTSAFMVKTPNGKDKLTGLLDCIDHAQKLVEGGHNVVHGTNYRSLRGIWLELQRIPFLGRFMAYEVVSDLRWTYLLEGAPDIMTWASVGPGCARGLSWTMYGDPGHFHYTKAGDEARMALLMTTLHEYSKDPACWPQDWPKWEMREVEHWACEVWKYARARYYGEANKNHYVYRGAQE